MLGEIESKSLELTGRKSNSSLNTIFTEILNGRNYTITTDNETLTIQLEDNENCSWLYNINSGLIYDLINYDNFTYKGAISQAGNTTCPFLFVEVMVGSITEQLRYKGNISSNYSFILSEKDKKILAEVTASLSLSSAAILLEYSIPLLIVGTISTPILIPFLIGISLIVIGYELNKYAVGDKEALGSTAYSFVQGLYL
ncbi:hypothetical protein [Methanobrevibacter sp.]|uniref:hypothetical protein n=1 Tax=Methanobrevibacter sp. TaxID=66852 RepID=UPI0025E4430A|nr:hypothetical protein [Methanobrevibacter sp.]MBQ2666877.1 hypothetical protein [Methanobrevibacter sp.]